MAVYKRTYRAYEGPLTPERTRFLVLTRYAWNYLFRSRFMTGFFIVCFFPALIMALGLYLNHSDSLMRLLRLPTGRALIQDVSSYLRVFMQIQWGFAMVLTAFAGPTLISPDLVNNALPLYFCRPFSRVEYVLGKFCVIAWLISLITWVPGLTLFGIEASQAGASWMWDHLWLANAIFTSSIIMVLVLSFIGLALSALVRWKPVAGALVLAVFFLGAGFGAAINAILRTTTGYYLDIGHMMSTIGATLFRIEGYEAGVSLTGAALQLAGVYALCLLMLNRKIRAFEVVR